MGPLEVMIRRLVVFRDVVLVISPGCLAPRTTRPRARYQRAVRTPPPYLQGRNGRILSRGGRRGRSLAPKSRTCEAIDVGRQP